MGTPTIQFQTTENVLFVINALTKLAQELNTKTENQPQSKSVQTIESIHQPYIDRLIKEVVEWEKSRNRIIDERDVTFNHIKGYQKYSQWETARPGFKYGFAIDEGSCLRIEQIENRLNRLKWLKNIENVEREFKNEVCRTLGLSESEICLQQHMVARYFNVDLKYNYLSIFKALDMDREQMKVATDVIFEIEDKYGIYDADREYGQKLEKAIKDVIKPYLRDLIPVSKKIIDYTDKEWYEWFEQIINEYEKLCYTDRDTAIEIIFNVFKNRTGFVSSGNLTIDIHEILSNKSSGKTLREKFSLCIANFFINMW